MMFIHSASPVVVVVSRCASCDLDVLDADCVQIDLDHEIHGNFSNCEFQFVTVQFGVVDFSLR